VIEDPSAAPPMQSDRQAQPWLPGTHTLSRVFLVVLAGLLVGYMFLGRGFAHIGFGPLYVGDWVLLLGVAAAGFALIRGGARQPITWTVVLLVAFAVLGAVRTFPYLGTHGIDALRDGVLWGYAAIALVVYLLVDRELLLRALRLYGWIVPVFALWLPISWNLFAAASAEIDPSRPGSFIPLVFFKGGDMAVHIVGVIAFMVLAAGAVWSVRSFGWRALIALPVLWTIFVAGTSNRGALVTAVVGIVVVALLAPKWRSWLPLVAAMAIFAIGLVVQSVIVHGAGPGPTATSSPISTPRSSPVPSPSSLPATSPAGTGVPSAIAHSGETSPAASSTLLPVTGHSISVANPGFELGPLDDGTIAGWTIRAAGPHHIVAGDAYRGARYASLQNVARAYEDTIRSSRIPFKVGPDIAVSVWVKAIAARPILEIYVDWYDSAGDLISSVFLGRRETRGLTIWQECTGAVAAPPNAKEADILLYEASGKATIGIDHVTVRSGDLLPKPVPPKGRPATLQQIIDNILSIFGSSSDSGLEGSKQFRLAWWGKIVDYTVFGKYFWTGKGFGVNLADADRFQSTLDHSLRSPHNTNMTVLARMGVPGLVLWVLLQGAFGIGLLRATFARRRAGDTQLAVLGGLILAYWVAMMVDTSFDPYLEGPQGGIWFWTIFGLGLVVIRLSPRHRTS
jgi:hypothetical protein